MDVPIEIVENTIIDWRKKEVSSEQKSLLLKIFLDEKKYSLRKASKELGIPLTTLYGWLNPESNKNKNIKNKNIISYDVISNNNVDVLLDRLLFVLTRKKYKVTYKTTRLINELKNVLEDFKNE